jgi:hypothetical protein
VAAVAAAAAAFASAEDLSRALAAARAPKDWVRFRSRDAKRSPKAFTCGRTDCIHNTRTKKKLAGKYKSEREREEG